jgi:hypothetical protein
VGSMLEFGPRAVVELRGVYRKCLGDRRAVGGAEAKVREDVVRHGRRMPRGRRREEGVYYKLLVQILIVNIVEFLYNI